MTLSLSYDSDISSFVNFFSYYSPAQAMSAA